jgi:hypothetical protein
MFFRRRSDGLDLPGGNCGVRCGVSLNYLDTSLAAGVMPSQGGGICEDAMRCEIQEYPAEIPVAISDA